MGAEQKKTTEVHFIGLKKLTKPTIADPRNLTQSIGVNPGFFFSGCQVKMFMTRSSLA